jgi:hypothetical protein
MIYEHSKQYRCPIVRGKARSDLDNLLPAYANILQEICPLPKQTFADEFNSKLSLYLPENGRTDKTLNNHRTEIAGKLFGLYYTDREGYVYVSDRALKLLEDCDQVSFFKDLCLAYQFPSGMSKSNIIQTQLDKGVSLRQLCFVLDVLLSCREMDLRITKKQIGYYVLNSEDVLCGRASVLEVVEQINLDIKNGIIRSIPKPEDKGDSYVYQHINEQLNLLYLANLVLFEDGVVALNTRELNFIKLMASEAEKKPLFDFYKSPFSSVEERKQTLLDWEYHFSQLSALQVPDTEITSLLPTPLLPVENTVLIGDEGEEYIYQLERDRVQQLNPKLLNKIKKMGKIKGIGFDIQSVFGDGEFPEFVKYIEVKTTKRATSPTQQAFQDTINLTRNEWIAAQQHAKHYFIYRLYLSQNGASVFIIENPFEAHLNKKLSVIPLTYRMDFDHTSGRFYA